MSTGRKKTASSEEHTPPLLLLLLALVRRQLVGGKNTRRAAHPTASKLYRHLRVTTSTRYCGLTTLYRILPTIAVLAAGIATKYHLRKARILCLAEVAAK